jgi:hypothetical protein
MRTLGGVLAVVAGIMTPGTVRAQYYEVPPAPYVVSPVSGLLGHPRYEEGGFFTAIEGKWIRGTNPMRPQQIAVRGFRDFDGSISGTPNTFLGSGAEALNTHQVSGPGTFVPGLNLTLGWRFESGVVLAFSYWHLADARYAASASILPREGPNADLSNTFLFAPVFNFGPEFAGEPQNVTVGNPGATFGIWNAAQSMNISFVQRFDLFDLSGRIPIWQTERSREYGLIGGRCVAIWERFAWRTVSADVTGAAAEDDVANYTNVVSNRLWGVHIGCGTEWFLGDTPIGGFSLSCDGEVGLYIDFVRERAKYVRDDGVMAASRARHVQTLAPGVECKVNLWWYPFEGISVRLGYDLMTFFNTVAAERPIDFNMGSIAPKWEEGITRFYHGLGFGVGFVF